LKALSAPRLRHPASQFSNPVIPDAK